MKFKEINPSPRTLMTPGPVEADPRVLRAMGAHILGQFDPEFTALMNETMEIHADNFQSSTCTSAPPSVATASTIRSAPYFSQSSPISFNGCIIEVEQISHFLRENGELYLSRKRLKRH